MEIKRGAPSFWCKSEDRDVKAPVIDPIYIYIYISKNQFNPKS
jgi:hypothetical protein